MIAKAFKFAYNKHIGHYRKGTKIPYIAHPMDVASILIKEKASEELIVAALLHDTVEDTDTSIEEIRKEFGNKVAELVSGVTEPDQSLSWMERKQDKINALKKAPYEIQLLSCADKLANLRDINRDYAQVGEKLWKRFNASKADIKWYYTKILKVFQKDLCNTSVFSKFEAEVKKCSAFPHLHK
jgi:(p)ppGpp synthase/HD superfamily hydrolase